MPSMAVMWRGYCSARAFTPRQIIAMACAPARLRLTARLPAVDTPLCSANVPYRADTAAHTMSWPRAA